MRFAGRAYKLEDVGRIAEVGLRWVEITLLNGGDLVYRPEDLFAATERWNLHYLVHAPNEGKPTEVERLGGPFFRDILRLLDGCVEIHAPLLTLHFWMDGRFIPPGVAERKRRILWEMARAGAARGVQVCLENLSERPDDLAPALEGCPELGLTLDLGHAQLMTQGNRALDFLARWPERVLHVHAHDNRGGNLVGDDLHLPIGDGIVDFPAILGGLNRTGYRGAVTLEVPLDHLAASVKRLRHILRSPRLEREEMAP